MYVPVKRAVVKLVGKDGSGKTSLLKSFKRLMFNKTQGSTPAIQIETIQQGLFKDHWQTLSERDIQRHLAAFMDQMAKEECYSKPTVEKSVAIVGRKSVEEKKQSSVLQHSNRETFEKQFVDLLGHSSLFPPKIMVQICDHGGQEDFFATSTTFASSGCICIVTLNIIEDLEAEARSFIRQTDTHGFKHENVKLHRMRHNKDWINHHLSVISVSQQSDPGQDGSEANSLASSNARSIGDALGTYSPPVIFAATHADQIPKGKEQEVIRSREGQLQKVLGGKGFSNHVYYRSPDERSTFFFCIDNTKSHPPPDSQSSSGSTQFDEEDSEVVELRQLIVSAVEKHGTVHLTRSTWLLLEDEVYKMREDPKKKIIPLQEIVALAREKCALNSESDVVSVIIHLHELHVVVYFVTCSELKQYVFIDAPWVFTTLSHLNSLKLSVPIRKGLFRSDVCKLQQRGVLSHELCCHLLDNPDGDQLTEGARSLMVKAAELLDILTPHKRKANDGEASKDGYVTEYFVPGALQDDDDKVPPRIAHSQSGVPSPVHLVLRPKNVGMFIEALFFRLINRCVRHYSAHPPYLQRNHTIFYMQNDCEIELFYVHDYVVVVMTPDSELTYEEIRRSCVETREFIVSQLEDVKKQGLAGFQFSVCFQHLTAEEQPFIPIQDDFLVCLDHYPQSKRLCYLNNKKVRLTEEVKECIAMWFPRNGEESFSALTADAIGEEEIMAPQIQQHPRKAKQQKLSHLSSPSPKHHKSDIDGCVSDGERVRVGQQITGEWEKVARLLEPQPLDRNSIVAIQKCERDPEEQAQKMLDEWYKKHGNEATRYRLIKALIEAEKKAIAESVFGGLVKAVEQKLSSSSEWRVAACPPRPDAPPPQEIIDIICSKGCEVWRQFGRGLGYDDSKLADIESGNPTCVNSEKLHKVLSHWKMKRGSDATLRQLIEVCQSDNVAIYGAVDTEIRRLYGTSITL